MKIWQGLLFVGFAMSMSVIGMTRQVSDGATITVTTVAYPKPGTSVTMTTIPIDLASYYAQHGLSLTQLAPNASTSGTRGEPPSIPPAPGPGDVRPDVGKDIMIIQQNGWTSTTTYQRSVTPTDSGGFSDGPWEYGGNTTVPSDGGGSGGGNCVKTGKDCAEQQ